MKSQLILFVFILVCSIARANNRDGMIATLEGQAEVLTPATTSEGNSALMSYEGKKFTFSKAKIGTYVEGGQIIRTHADSKSKIILKHGDVFVLGPSTAFEVPLVDTQKTKAPSAQLQYGKIRATVDPQGPLSGLQIITRTAVMGVRGTDLFVGYNPAIQSTELIVLRGDVGVVTKPSDSNESTKTENSPAEAHVKTGESTSIKSWTPSSDTPQMPPELNIMVTSKDQLKDIKTSTSPNQKKYKLPPIEEQTQVEIKNAEAKAADNILKDIRRYNPDFKLDAKHTYEVGTDSLNEEVLVKAEKSAPAEVKNINTHSPEIVAVHKKKWSVVMALINTTVTQENGSAIDPGTDQGGLIGAFLNWPQSDRWRFQVGMTFSKIKSSYSFSNNFFNRKLDYSVLSLNANTFYRLWSRLWGRIGLNRHHILSSNSTCSTNSGFAFGCEFVTPSESIPDYMALNIGLSWQQNEDWSYHVFFEHDSPPGQQLGFNHQALAIEWMF